METEINVENEEKYFEIQSNIQKTQKAIDRIKFKRRLWLMLPIFLILSIKVTIPFAIWALPTYWLKEPWTDILVNIIGFGLVCIIFMGGIVSFFITEIILGMIHRLKLDTKEKHDLETELQIYENEIEEIKLQSAKNFLENKFVNAYLSSLKSTEEITTKLNLIGLTLKWPQQNVA